MRKPRPYAMYLFRLQNYYGAKHQPQPEWINKALSYFLKMEHAGKSFSEMCSNNAIPKSTMVELSSLKPESLTGLPYELTKNGIDVNSILIDMYTELMSDRETYFLNEWTLTRKGRVKMREYVNRIPSSERIRPPKDMITNVPTSIVYRNREGMDTGEFFIDINLFKFRIEIGKGQRTRNSTIDLDFTEKLLGEIIVLLQWDNIKECDLLTYNKVSEKEEVSYDQSLLVEIERDTFEIKFSEVDSDNVLLRVLKLIWDEYGEMLIQQGFAPMWSQFDT